MCEKGVVVSDNQISTNVPDNPIPAVVPNNPISAVVPDGPIPAVASDNAVHLVGGDVSRETSAELVEALETISRLTERLELLESKLSTQYTSTSQSPEMSEGESYVYNPTSLTSRILADNGIKEEM